MVVVDQDTSFVLYGRAFTKLEQPSMDESFEMSANTTFDSEIWTVDVDRSYESDNSHVHFSWVECSADEAYSS